MINLNDYKELILEPSLKEVEMHSLSAEKLVLGTGLVESRMTHLRQIKGPALGFFQIEPFTYKDLMSYLHGKPDMLKRLLKACEYEGLAGDTERVLTNIKWSTLLCRIFYWRFEEPLPEHDDIHSIANYWKKYYNTSLGSGQASEFVRVYNKYTKLFNLYE